MISLVESYLFVIPVVMGSIIPGRGRGERHMPMANATRPELAFSTFAQNMVKRLPIFPQPLPHEFKEAN